MSKSSNGFGGDLRYGEADGLSGADKICREIAEASLAGAGTKTWRAFLSGTKGADGNPVHAIDRVPETVPAGCRRWLRSSIDLR